MNATGLFCSQCGELNDPQAKFCRKCGAVQPVMGGIPTASAQPAIETAPAQPAIATAPTQPPVATVPAQPASVPPALQAAPPSAISPGAAYATPAPTFNADFGYGGFWLRVLATCIDSLLTGIVVGPILFVLIMMSGLMAERTSRDPQAAANAVLSLIPLIIVIPLVVAWLYEAYLTSSPRQATFGHQALHMKVVDKSGQRLSFGHATGRYFAKMVNNFTFYIGWLLVAFTERKQGLHDMIAGTYMVKTQ